jgi:primase-polymerase (primpol)-like protein
MNGGAAVSLSTIPFELTEHPQWVGWRWGAERNGRREKVPYNPRTGQRASVSDPSTWATFEKAARVVKRYDGLGFVLTRDDPFVGIDLDHCIDLGTGTIEEWAWEIIGCVRSYTEITPSGKGIRIFVRGSLPSSGRRRGNVEIYDHSRFLTLTGQHLGAVPTQIENREQEIHDLHAKYFHTPPVATNEHPRQTVPPPVADLAEGDHALLLRAHQARGVLEFADLYSGNIAGYRSQSEADLALCNCLARCGGDATQIDRLFRRSALYRLKWDRRHSADGRTYGEMTIAKTLKQAGHSHRGG